MQAILDFFAGIGDAIVSVIDFVISLFGDLVYMVQITGVFIAEIPNYFAWLPGPLLSLIIVIFAVVVLYKILGREG